MACIVTLCFLDQFVDVFFSFFNYFKAPGEQENSSETAKDETVIAVSSQHSMSTLPSHSLPLRKRPYQAIVSSPQSDVSQSGPAASQVGSICVCGIFNFEPICAQALWAHMHHFAVVTTHKFRLEKNNISVNMPPRITKFGNRMYPEGTKVDREGQGHRYFLRLEKNHTSVNIAPRATKIGTLS